MPTRPYEQLAARSRKSRSPQATQIAEQLGSQLDAEITAQVALGSELRAAREAVHLAQPRLAEISDVQQAEISRIERGLGNPTRDTLLRITNALGMRLTLNPANAGVEREPQERWRPTSPKFEE